MTNVWSCESSQRFEFWPFISAFGISLILYDSALWSLYWRQRVMQKMKRTLHEDLRLDKEICSDICLKLFLVCGMSCEVEVVFAWFGPHLKCIQRWLDIIILNTEPPPKKLKYCKYLGLPFVPFSKEMSRCTENFFSGRPNVPPIGLIRLYIRVTAVMQNVHVSAFHRWQATWVFVVCGFVHVLMEVGQAFTTFFSLGGYSLP